MLHNGVELVMTDLDGTLLGADNALSLENARALDDLKKHGVKVCVATGRGPQEVKMVCGVDGCRSLGCPTGVYYNGAYVVGPNGEVLKDEKLKPKDTNLVVDTAKRLGYEGYLVAYGTNGPECLEKNSQVASLNEIYGAAPAILTPKFGGDGYYKISFIGSLEAGQRLVEEMDLPHLSASRATPQITDIGPHNTNKGEAGKLISESLEIEMANVAAIGDSFNDKKLLETVGHSFAVANAHPDIQKIAANIVPSNVAQGFSRMVYDYILSRKNVEKPIFQTPSTIV